MRPGAARSGNGPKRPQAASGQGPYTRLPRAPSERGLQHDRRAGLAAGAGLQRAAGARETPRSVGRQADSSIELEPPLGGGSGERCKRAARPEAAEGRFGPPAGSEGPGFTSVVHVAEAPLATHETGATGGRSRSALAGPAEGGGGKRESNPPGSAWRHPPGLKPGRSTRIVSPPLFMSRPPRRTAPNRRAAGGRRRRGAAARCGRSIPGSGSPSCARGRSRRETAQR